MIEFDFKDFDRAAKRMGKAADQVPFALAQAMNDALKAARDEIAQKTWPEHMHVRNSRFMGRALTREFATKKRLEVALFDSLGNANLVLHEKGGSRQGRGALAVPTSAIAARRGAMGIPKGIRPKALPRSFAKPGKSGDMLIFQRTGSYKKAGKRSPAKDNRHLKLAYVLKGSTPIPAQVPFHSVFASVMRREVVRAFGFRLNAAMAKGRK